MAGKVTEAKFKMIKTLINSGMSYSEISESADVSKVVIGMIKRANTLEEYKQKMITMSGSYRRRMAKQKKEEEQLIVKAEDVVKAAEKPQAESPTMMISGYQVNRMIELLTKQNEILTLISNKLAFIVDELTK